MILEQDSAWTQGPLDPQLSAQEIHIWRIVLPISDAIKIALQKNLSHNELSRLNQFRFNKDKERYLLARGGLRDIIGRYLKRDPAKIDFQYTEFSKPYIDNENLFFNVSHSIDCILYAISAKPSIGIDVEYCNPHIDFLSTAKQFFSQNEYYKLLTVPSEERYLAFYRCWTRKEAYLKAIGKGFHFSPDQLEVTLLSSEEVKLLSISGKSEYVDKWTLEEIKPGYPYIASVASQLKYGSIFLWDWTAKSLSFNT